MSRPYLAEWRQAIMTSDLPAPARLVGFVLSTYANADGTSVRPGVPRLTKESGLGRRTVQRGLRDLEAAGLVDVVVPGGSHDGERRASEYHLTLDRRQSGTGATAAPVPETTPTGAGRAPDRRHSGAPPIHRPIQDQAGGRNRGSQEHAPPPRTGVPERGCAGCDMGFITIGDAVAPCARCLPGVPGAIDPDKAVAL